MKSVNLSAFLPLTLAFGALACGLPSVATVAPSPVPTEGVATEAVPVASPTVAPEADIAAVVVQPNSIELYRLDGTPAGSWDAPGIDWPRPDWVQVVGASVYYVDDTGQLRAVSAQGTAEFAFTASPNLMAFAVSPDEAWLSWATTSYGDKLESQLWMAAIDGSGKRLVAQSDPQDEIADWFALEPVSFAADGRLVYSWQITGIGGYILFFGYSSLYSYDPATTVVTPLAPLLSDSTGPCWNNVRSDLAYAVGYCYGAEGDLAMRERDLATGEDLVFPSFPDQGQAGAAAYSPSGHRLAYAIARGNPDDEAGQIIVRLEPAGEGVPFASISNGYFHLLYWLDEERLLAGGSEGGVDRVYRVGLDGSVTPVAEGRLAGWMVLP
jgi:hypothetical protein